MVELKLSATPRPYVIIPATPEVSHQGRFRITVSSTTKPVQLSKIDPSRDWKFSSITGSWNDVSSGGCRHHRSWRKNPQFKLFVTKPTNLTITLQIHLHPSASSSFELPDYGFYVTKSIDANRKTLTLFDDELILKSRFAASPEISEEVFLQPRDMPYIIIATTREPHVKHDYTLSIFTDEEVLLEEVSDSWNEVSVSGEWRGDSPPRFQLHLKEPESTTVLPLISQEDNRDVLESIGVSMQAKGNTVSESQMRASWEVASNVSSLNPEDGPFIIKPVIQDPHAKGRFSLTVFSDKEVSIAREPE